MIQTILRQLKEVRKSKNSDHTETKFYWTGLQKQYFARDVQYKISMYPKPDHIYEGWS